MHTARGSILKREVKMGDNITEVTQEDKNTNWNAKIEGSERKQDYQQMYESCKKDYEDLKKKHEQLEEKYQILTRKENDRKGLLHLFGWRQKPTVQVEMYAAFSKPMCNTIMDELENKLSMLLKNAHTSLQVEKRQEPTRANGSVPLIVLCMNATRLGIDVNKALRDISRSRPIAVVVLHHQDVHALPKVSSEKLLCADEFTDIRHIVDMAFLPNKGIYQCEMNKQALNRMVDFIKPH